MKTVTLCQEMKWTYQEFLSQPKWLTELLMSKMKIDSKEMERESKRKK